MRDVRAVAGYLRDRFGFEVVHESDVLAIARRDEAVVHLWGATDGLFAELAAREVLHPASWGGVMPTAFGTREAALDLDGNLLTFFATPAP